MPEREVAVEQLRCWLVGRKAGEVRQRSKVRTG